MMNYSELTDKLNKDRAIINALYELKDFKICERYIDNYMLTIQTYQNKLTHPEIERHSKIAMMYRTRIIIESK